MLRSCPSPPFSIVPTRSLTIVIICCSFTLVAKGPSLFYIINDLSIKTYDFTARL
ncbi:unnamed protein product [Schistosoma mattheei]|uniref:Uncharacterized protein n=1 Tax=Schistosoma mattheei TaxID=31246 RepID=A0A183PKQ4_9TREM|nr:unnamed protein product [Schistosoma mattheei]